MHIIVIVLGDLGRSPRMQYHCQSLLDAGHHVTAIGYEGEDLIPALIYETHLQVIRLRIPTLFKNTGPAIIYFVWRIVSLSLYLGYALLMSVKNQPVDFVLVQNPPAIPLLGVAYVFCRIKALTQGRRPGFIIDWHNLGYSMLKDESTIQRIAKVYESYVAPLADGHLTVTKAMKEHLMATMGISRNINVLYDCPPDMFAPLEVSDQHAILSKLHSDLAAVCPHSWSTSELQTPRQTLFTELLIGKEDSYRPRPGRPALVTTSTSWTADEDFGLLLDALQQLDELIKTSDLHVVFVVTGKGPQRAMYEEKMSRLQLVNVAVATVWLEAADYPKLLACADVGVSLHTSTSGLDLPMKVLDLFGCEVPVFAYDFSCLSELVQDNVNGRVFRTSQELADLLYEVLLPLVGSSTRSTPTHSYGALQVYSQQLRGRTRWNTNWMEHALPVLMLSTPMR